MKIAVLKEKIPGEHRVAATPDTVKKFIAMGFEVCIEKGAGESSSISDADYIAAGAKISSILLEIVADSDIVLKVQPSHKEKKNDLDELAFLREGSVIIGMLSPFETKNLIKLYAYQKITAFSMEFIPRITRAQSMDVLSSQSNLAGYRAVIEAMYLYKRAMPMMMTAAGTIPPARVLVLGAGVAGLQAVATAKRMGAIVSAFDVRRAAKEQVESLGANFIEVEGSDAETKAGYAKEMDAEYKARQEKLIEEVIAKSDIVITTALIPGKAAPKLISNKMISLMKQGSIIVDMAAIAGGNTELTVMDEIFVTDNGVSIIGYSNLPSNIATDASKLYANNLYHFINLLYDKNTKRFNVNLEDEIIKSSLLTHNGEIVHEFYNN